MTSNVEPFNCCALSYEEKRRWLYDHGYLVEVEGVECLNARAAAQLGGNAVTSDELASAVKSGCSPEGIIERMRDGAALMRDIYGTDDMVEILYASLSEEEASAR